MKTIADGVAQFQKSEQIRLLMEHFAKIEVPEAETDYELLATMVVRELESETNAERFVTRVRVINELLNKTKEVGHE